ncbi:MAG: rod shape-determining protein MreD [Trueperaceae bacterium]
MRLFVFYLLLILGQGFLSALLAPLPAPDLFLLAMLTLVGRLAPWQLVSAGYGIGLLQDLIGNGVLGVHAFALSGAAMAALVVTAQLSQVGFFERVLKLLAAVVGKWVAMAAMVVWLSGTFETLLSVPLVAAFDLGFTVIVGLWLLPWADALFERASILRKELL